MSRLMDLFTAAQFVTGLLWGVAALVVGGLLSLGWRRWRDEPAPLGGGLLAAAVFFAMPEVRETPLDLAIGLVMLTAAGLAFPLARKVPGLPGILALPGAWWIVQVSELPVGGWRSLLLLSMILVGAPLTASFDRHHADRGLAPVFLAVTIFGAYTTLPDTEEILVMLGAAIPLTLLAWPRAMVSLGAWGAYPVVGMLAWVIAWGGRGRETAIIGAAAGLGLLVVEPTVRMLRSSTLLDRIPRSVAGPVIAGLAQAVVVAITARVAGLQSSPVVSTAIALATLTVAWIVLATFAAPERSGRHER